MRTTHSRWPSTSNRFAEPASTSFTEHTRRSPTAVLDLLDHGAAERTRERRDGQAVEHVVEEAEHDQSLRLRRRHAAALEVIELILVDGADGARVRAPHVVGLDLEIRDGFGPRALGEHEVAVGLAGLGLSRRGAETDEARVDGVGLVVDRALEQQTAASVRRVVVLQGA